MNQEAVKPDYQSNPHFTFHAFGSGTDPIREAGVFALRYQVYCLERGFLPCENYPDGLEQDGYDPYSTYIAAYSLHGDLVGAMRLVKPPATMPFPFHRHCPHISPNRAYPPDGECIELSRLVISKVFRRRADDDLYGFSPQFIEEYAPGSDAASRQAISTGQHKLPSSAAERRNLRPVILLGLFREMYRHCKLNGISHWYVAMEKSLARLLKGLFYRTLDPIGEQVDYYGPVSPYLLSIPELEETVSVRDPVLFAWFQESLDG